MSSTLVAILVLSWCILELIHRLTFSPSPHGDRVLRVKTHGQKELPVATKVDTAHTHSMGSLQDGQCLLSVVIPDMDGSHFTNLT